MEALTASVDDLESAFERKDVENVDPSKVRNLLKIAGGSQLGEEEAVALKRLGLRIWNACVKLSQAQSSFTMAVVKVSHLY
jgi:hypothetical protein